MWGGSSLPRRRRRGRIGPGRHPSRIRPCVWTAKALHREIAAVIDRYAEGAEDAQEPGADTPEHQVFWIQGVTG
jgi:2,4-dienoyl-CoA reductase-like NADH-dependent reductase (Old Yellow Enzyme family)